MVDTVVKSAGRALQVLEVLDAAARDMRFSEITEALGIPQSSASMLIKSLTTLGFLDFDAETRTYRPSIRVAMLGTWVLGEPTRTADILNMMRRVHEKTGQTVALSAQNGVRLQYVNVIESTDALRLIINPGVSRPIHMGASGVVLLALKSDDEIKRLLRFANASTEEERYKAKEADVMTMVGIARRQGYFHSDGLYTPNGGVLAVPVVLGGHSRPMALGIGGPNSIFDGKKEMFLKSLKTAVDVFLAERNNEFS